MNLSTSSSKSRPVFRLYRSIFRPLVICIFLVVLYQTLIVGGVVPPSSGINQWQGNVVKAERYVYEKKSDIKIAIVGSSIGNRIKPEYIGPNVANLAMSAYSSQTGLEIVKRNKLKPSTVLIEINNTIARELNQKMIDYLYNPVFYLLRSYLPILRQEYQPISVLISYLKDSKGKNKPQGDEEKNALASPKLRKRLIDNLIKTRMNPLQAEIAEKIRQEAENIKAQIAALKESGVRVVLFNVPGEARVEQTIAERQERKLIEEIFPQDTFEWLPEPPSENWRTEDGIHLIDSNAKKYGAFLKEKLENLAPRSF